MVAVDAGPRQVPVHFHAGHDGHGHNGKVPVVIETVVRERHKVEPVLMIVSDHVRRIVRAVRAGGMAVQRPFEQFVFPGKCRLTFHHDAYLLFLYSAASSSPSSMKDWILLTFI